jgi:tetratricopeptide (TPR) repeat protein
MNEEGLQEARELLDSGDLDGCLRAAGPFLEGAAPGSAREANRLVGLCRFRQRDYQASLQHFREAARESPEAIDWFNLASAELMAARPDGAEEAFQKAMDCQEASGYTQQPGVPFMMYFFMSALSKEGFQERAFGHLEELRKLYEAMKITDDTFVYVRGIPFLSQTMEAALPVLSSVMSRAEALEWLRSFSRRLDNAGRKLLEDLEKRLDLPD